MDLKEFTAGTPATKPWLTIVAKSCTVETATVEDLKVDNVDVNELHANLLSLADTGSVPNPPIGFINLYSTGTELKSVDPLGADTTYLTTANCGDLVHVEELNAVQNRIGPLAPAGLRDTWQSPIGVNFDGAAIQYFDGPDILYAGNAEGFPVGAQYSTDGGVTWLPVVFDVAPPSGLVPAFGYNGAGLYVGLTFDATDPSYTSVDGVNYVAGAPSGVANYGWQLPYVSRLGLFVSGGSSDATHWISTSPDGITWTPRTTPDLSPSFNGTTIMDSGSILVIAGNAGGNPSAAWSTDGIVWTAGTGMNSDIQCGTYSADLKEFVVASDSTGEVFRSTDGKAWVSLGNQCPAPAGPTSMIWVGGDIRLYYVSSPVVTATGNYSLWCSPAADKLFVTTYLKGANERSPYSAVVYLPSYNRFVVGASPNGVGYSTAAPYTVKAVSDNINVRGSPVSVDQYSNSQSVLVVNTALATTLTPAANSLGSMILQDSQPVGMVVDFCFFLEVSSVLGDFLTIELKTQAGVLYSDVLTIPALAAGLPICVRGSMTVQAAAAAVAAVTVQDTATTVSIQSGAFDPSIENTLNITAQWAGVASSLEMTQMILNTHFRNGA